ncbi:MAG: response regulator [Noviherbaspirillum sp.]
MTAPPLQILVVEDNQVLLRALCEMLTVLGHRVHGVGSAEAALEPLRSGQYKLLLADLHLPGMSGIDLARLAVDMVPGMRIIFASGFGYLLAERLEFDFELLHKPYFFDQLKLALMPE